MNLVEKGGALNTAASVHLKDVLHDLNDSRLQNKDITFRAVASPTRVSHLIKNVDHSETGTEVGGRRNVQYLGTATANSIDGVSKVAVQKLPVSSASILCGDLSYFFAACAQHRLETHGINLREDEKRYP